MNQQQNILYLLIAYIHISSQVSTQDSETYMAAVVEYPPRYITNNSKLTLQENSDAYVKHIKRANMHGADIIVFPEDGLTSVHLPKREDMEDWTTIIPAASDNYIPCNQNTIKVSEALKKISCAAKENQIYIVINIAEKLPCIENICPRDKMFYYNSNVVFDRTGKIIARYRKTNLFTEPQFNVTSIPEIVVFDTDFGVKFGTFICFDIMFDEPALQLTRHHQITDIVFPTAWFSEVPFLTAVQTQAGWSYAEDVNLLASGYNRPAFGNSGSGIYLGRKGIGKAILPQTTYEELLLFQVPKIKKKIRSDYHYDNLKERDHTTWPYYHGKKHIHDELRKKRNDNTLTKNDTLFLLHDNIQAFETFLLQENVTKKICQNSFCCEFKVKTVKIDPKMKYRLVIFAGMRIYGIVESGALACGIVQCTNESILSCGSVQESETTFNNIEILATIHDYKNMLIMPSTLNSDLLPLRNWIYNEHVHNDHMHISMYLNNNINNLLTFGIYMRNFNKNNASTTMFFSLTYFGTLQVILLLILDLRF